MRNILCIVSFLLFGGSIQAQPEVVLFDGKTTSGWVIEGDAEVKDGVLILGGNQRTWGRVAADFGPYFELQLEYSTDNNKPIQLEWRKQHFLGHGSGSRSLDRTSKKPGEWIEAIYWGQDDPANGWSTNSKWRVVGDPAFAAQLLGGSSSVPRSVVVAFEIPAGQKLYLRNVRAKPDPASSFLWLVVFVAGVLLVVLVSALVAWAVMKKRRAPTKGHVQPEKAIS